MFQFENTDILYFLLLIPVFVGLFWLSRISWKKRLSNYGDLGIVKRLLKNYSTERSIWKFVLEMTTLALLIFALANPQFGSRLKEVKREGVEIMIALDVSRSMEARDIKPNRLSKAKRSVELFMNKLDGDIVGMVVFAGEAYIQIPMTDDYASAKMYLSNIDTDLVPVQGTNLADAIDMSVKAFSEDPESSKIIMLISDGENHEADAGEAAELAANDGVIIYTVGMGTREGAPIPAVGGGFYRDKSGNIISSKLNEKILKEIAEKSDGNYMLAGKSGTGLDHVLDEISKLNKTERSVETFSEFDDQYQYPLALAMLLLIVELLIPRRKIKNVKSS
ncbi:MAG: VWA domain-containing protein [Bacteroidota bacterium]|nr:VWA domain-containing protein [Bacteroidota bacterium]